MTTRAKLRRYRKGGKLTRRNIYINDSVYGAIGEKATKHEISISEYIEIACREKLQREK